MAWIRTVLPKDAKGLLARIYRVAEQRAGKVFNVLRVQSISPRVLQVSTRLYTELMHAPGPLTRRQREMIAVSVSRENACHY